MLDPAARPRRRSKCNVFCVETAAWALFEKVELVSWRGGGDCEEVGILVYSPVKFIG